MTTTQHPAPPREAAIGTGGQAAQLRRSRDDRMLFGVCAGLGRYLGIDPVFVRVAFVLLAVFGGSGLLLYLIGLVAIPSAAQDDAVEAGVATAANSTAVVLGAALVAVGALLLAGRMIPAFGDLVAPLVLLSAGILVLLAGRR